MGQKASPTLAAYRPKQRPAAVGWLVMALCGLALAVVFFLIAGSRGPSWAFRLRDDCLTLFFVVPALIAMGTWVGLEQGLFCRFERRELRDLHYLFFAAWSAVAACICVAQVWADRAWIVPSLPASLSLALGTGALIPLFISTFFPRALRREKSTR